MLRAFVEGKNTIWYNEEQACNVSLSQDGSNRTLFLDFASKTGVDFAGSNYGTHQRILIADSTGSLINAIPSPANYSFDHSEWAPGGIVATLANDNEVHEAVVFVNPSDSSVTRLVEGPELWHPNLWSRKGHKGQDESNLDLDSAGVYYRYNAENYLQSTAVETALRMQDFWRVHQDVEFIALGSSMTLDALVADSIKTYKSLNMSMPLADIHFFQFFLRKYIFPYAEKVKAVMVELTPGFVYRDWKTHFAYVYSFSPGLLYDFTHLDRCNKDSIAARSQEQVLPRDMYAQNYMEGIFLLPSNSWGDTYVSVTDPQVFEDVHVQENLGIYRDLKAEAEALGIKIFLTITPRNPKYRNTEYFDVVGPKWDVANQIIESVKSMGYYVFDEYKGGNHDYSGAMANDNVHLSYKGAEKYTRRLDSLLATMKD